MAKPCVTVVDVAPLVSRDVPKVCHCFQIWHVGLGGGVIVTLTIIIITIRMEHEILAFRRF